MAISTKGIVVKPSDDLELPDPDVKAWAIDTAGRDGDKRGVVVNIHDSNGLLLEVTLTENALLRLLDESIG